MTLIEGVGDEVTDFFFVVAIFIVGYLAWCSTRITDLLLVRTVLILPPRSRTRMSGLRGRIQDDGSTTQLLSSELNEQQTTESAVTEANQETASTDAEPSTAVSNTEVSSEENGRIETNSTEEVLIEAMDSFTSESTALRQRKSKINGNDTSIDSSNCIAPQEDISTSNASEISIRLKFINDDQKIVTGSLKELLGDFKRRHFQIELQAQKLVRLVFNGRILQPDSQTLERCGLFDNCVVHCLVHQPQPNPTPTQSTPVDERSVIYFRPDIRVMIPQLVPPPENIIMPMTDDEWDLSRVLARALALSLATAWYLRYEFAQFFTATTTVGLYALTVMFTVAIFISFMFDEDNIQNIE